MTEPLPAGWAFVRLPELIGSRGLLVDGDWVESKDQDPSGEVRLTQLADVGDGFFRNRSNRFMTAAKATAMNCTVLEIGDVMVARMPDPLGRACVFPGGSQPCVTVVDVCIVRPGTRNINTRWLMNCINSPDSRIAISALQAGSTRKRISKKNLCTIKLPVPPLPEQHRIVEAIESYFTRLDDAVATLSRVERNLKRYRASVLKSAVEGRLVPTEAALAKQEHRDYEPASALLERILTERRRRWSESGKKGKYEEPAAPDTTNLPELPEGWCWATLSAVADVQLGQQRAPVHATATEQIPYVRTANITWAGLDLTDVNTMGFPNPDRYRLEFGDVLLSEASGSPMEAGKPAIWKNEIPGACYQKTVLRVRAFDKSCVLPAFLRAVFLRDCFVGKFAKLAPGVGIVHITAERLVDWAIPLAPTAEQQRITTEIERQESVIDATSVSLKRQRSQTARLRQSILKWAFEGKLADQDPNDEPASVLLERIKAERSAPKAAVPSRSPRVAAKKRARG